MDIQLSHLAPTSRVASAAIVAPPPTKGSVPAVPMRYRAHTVQRKLTYSIFFSNALVVVLLLLAVGLSFLPTPPPPNYASYALSCPFDVVACNRQCALMHVECEEDNNVRLGPQRRLAGKKNKVDTTRDDCDGLHGIETANRSTAAFDSVESKTAYLESLDWENEPSLWGLRNESIGDGHCDRGVDSTRLQKNRKSGCGATLCECQFDGGDCVEEVEDLPVWVALAIGTAGAFLWYLCVMCTSLNGVTNPIWKAPKLRDERELTAYITEMQRAQLQVGFSVVCSHTEKSKGSGNNSHTGTSRSKKSYTVVTHRSSHPFAYAASTDVSTLTKNWQQPAAGGGGEDGSLGTGFAAVVNSKLSWTAANGVTADKLKAEKTRLYEENKDHDTECSVKFEVSLPGKLSCQMYAPAGATKRLPLVCEYLLVFLGLGAPLWFYYERRLSKHVEHTVRKTIYIEGHAAPAGSSGGGVTDEQL